MHDKGLLQGICKHGIGRHDLLINDPELPFYAVKKRIIEEHNIQDPDGEEQATLMEKLSWPKDLVIARRIDALCELVLRPKPPSKRQLANRKRKAAEAFEKSPEEQAAAAAASSSSSINNNQQQQAAMLRLTVNGPRDSPRGSGYDTDIGSVSSHIDDGGYSDSGEDADQPWRKVRKVQDF